MPTNVEIPPLGDSVTEAVLIKWLKSDGQAVTKDEALCELETDKANVELPSPSAGVLRTTTTEGATVKIHEVVARIDEAGAAAPTPPAKPVAPTAPAATNGAPATAPKPPAGGGDLSPAVLRMVTESAINPADVAATGKDGRITKEDVINHLAAGASAADKGSAPAPAPTPPAAAKAEPAKAKPPAETFTSDGAGSRRTPMSKLRVAIAKRLVEAQHTAAILTTFNEVDLTEVMALRAKFKDTFEKAHGVGLGFMSFFAKAVCAGLKEFPRVNGSIDGADMVLHDYVHLGVAVSTERGLVVPVLRNVQSMSFAKIESEVKRVAVAARDGKVGPAEMSGATFTVTNGGVFGSLLSTPILTPPQSGILGMHTIQRRPVAVGPKLDQVEIRPMMYVALSYDHRLVDGKESVSFLVKVKQLLEDPSRMMLEV